MTELIAVQAGFNGMAESMLQILCAAGILSVICMAVLVIGVIFVSCKNRSAK
jgi:hypothetical protein